MTTSKQNWLEEELTIHAAYPLSGTVTLPQPAGDGKVPGIVIVPGTGQTDRDGSSPKIRMNLYNDLSYAAAEAGYAVLRYDKRGVGRSGGDYYETGLYDLVDDAAHALDALAAHPGVDPERMVLIGHSEGAILAPAIHKKRPVQGMILLAGVAESTEQALKRQFDGLVEELHKLRGVKGWLVRMLGVPKKVRKQNEQLHRKIASSTDTVLRYRGVKLNAKWMREHQAFDVMEMMAHVDCPLLAATGSADLQVVPEHAKLLAEAAQGPAEGVVLEGMNHILREQREPAHLLNMLQQYKKQADEPLHSELIRVLQQFLKRQLR